MMHDATNARFQAQIKATGDKIKAAPWAQPADIERAKVLISKRTGLRILTGEQLVGWVERQRYPSTPAAKLMGFARSSTHPTR